MEYPKIETVWHRDPATKHKTVIHGAWSRPEFDWLKACEWIWTEKVDGTNIRVGWDGKQVSLGGRTDAAQIPAALVARLQELFPVSLFQERYATLDCITLYGEGYGAKIQQVGSRYKSDGVDFILFDVRIGDTWLAWDNVKDVAATCGIAHVPEVGRGSLIMAIDQVQYSQLESAIAENQGVPAEGLVLRPPMTLLDNRGRRIIAKIKARDFTNPGKLPPPA